MRTFLREARRAIRRLRRSPGFSVMATACLALGIGAAATAFGVVNGLFLRPLQGIDSPDRLVMIEASPSSYPNFRDIRAAATSFSGVAAFRDQLMSLATEGEPEQVLGQAVSADYFRLLGTVPALGRTLDSDDARAEAVPVVVLSHRMWRTRFGADPAVLGRTIRLNGLPVTVVGVAPEGFVGVFRGFQFDVWVPISTAVGLIPGLDIEARDAGRLQMLGRLRDGRDWKAAASEVAAIGERLRAAYPEPNLGLQLSVERYNGFDPDLRGGAMVLVAVLLSVAGLLLLIACSNVANMLMARSSSRSREVAVRLALGGRRSAITAVVVSESLLLASLAVAFGLALAQWASYGLRSLVAAFPVPLALDIGVDARVAGFALAIALLTGLAAAVAPAIQVSRADVAEALKAAGRSVVGRSRLGRIFVVVQVALSAVLLVSAGLFLRTLLATAEMDPGFDLEAVQVAPFIDVGSLRLEEGEASKLYERLRERVAGLPGVQSASLVGNVPLSFTGQSTTEVAIEGIQPPEGREGIEVDFTTIAPDYFATMGIAVRAGRDFDGRDVAGAPPVAVVNETMARRFWPEEEAVGQTLRHGGRTLRIVGLVADSRSRALDESAHPFLYVPHTQSPDPRMNLVVRAAPGAVGLGAAVRRALAEVEPALAPPRVQPLTDFLALSLLPQRAAAGFGGVLGVVGLFLAALGIFGVVSFSVSRRVREMGIRLALGSDRLGIMRLIVGEGVVLALLGLAVGVPLALAGSGLLSGLLFGVSRADPVTYLAAAAVLVAAAAMGSGLPAWRASRVDPMTALREE